ncbi:GAF domain-containing protein [Spirulina major CS-329]|uniref:GAF domain-containing protein n=1 Tax=Spirulina TaxID=1154 RepID=UPI00232E972B|nr:MULTISPECIES: GAF domain-containing protein [Spirulina]MDB9495413.1 GAF domain-containing protein [Spirulina subsalsa CS-330]MDB9504061.1 GAF domain-containing protein [Spirulina major CS-329]
MTEPHLLDIFSERNGTEPTTPAAGQGKLLTATLHSETWELLAVNGALAQLAGLPTDPTELAARSLNFFDLCPPESSRDRQSLQRRLRLPLILRDIAAIAPQDWRLWDEPQIFTLHSPHHAKPRYIQGWFRWEHLRAHRIDPTYDELADLDLHQPASLSQTNLETRIAWNNYQIEGDVMWEGIDITPQETLRRLNHVLVDVGSAVFDPEHLHCVGHKLHALFHATTTLILSMKQNRVQPFLFCKGQAEPLETLTLKDLEQAHALRAIQAHRVWNVPDLEADCPTPLEQILLERGCRSLLLIPVSQSLSTGGSEQVLGVVILGCPTPHQYDQLDAAYAEQLIPAFRTALRQANQNKLMRVHPAVEWRFAQEAERRSLGLPPEQIVFRGLYPMYGMSDIRGSSDERNRAIQADLLAQFNLAIAIIDRVLENQAIAFLQQVRADLQLQIDRLAEGIKVEDEVTALDYLHDHVEAYFDYFEQCSPAVKQAIATYEQACNNDHHCIYHARARYDSTVQQITAHLRDTWEQWQTQMQTILPHYCDTEVTDGIDHMIYLGKAIHPQFSQFHLHSLRYEQLRALCDCARTCFNLRDEQDNPLQVAHLILVQDITVDIFHDEQTEKLFDVMGTRDTRYEIVKKRIDKAISTQDQARITQPGMLTIVYSTESEWLEYQHYLRYLEREGWITCDRIMGAVEPLQGVTGLKFARVEVVPTPAEKSAS